MGIELKFLVWAIVLYGYRWSAARMDGWLARLLGL